MLYVQKVNVDFLMLKWSTGTVIVDLEWSTGKVEAYDNKKGWVAVAELSHRTTKRKMPVLMTSMIFASRK